MTRFAKWLSANWVEALRMFTFPTITLVGALVSIMLWVYMGDREDSREFRREISHEIRVGFKEISEEFKAVRKDNALSRSQTEAKLGCISGACCSEIRGGRVIETSDSIEY